MLKMAGAIAAEMLYSILRSYSFVVLYVLVIFFIKVQYRKYNELQSEIYGRPAYSTRDIIEKIFLAGLAAGFASSFLTVAAGVTIETDTIRYLFYVMCLLLLIDLRFVSIPYAAGLLAAVSLIPGTPQIYLPSLLFLVAVLQLAESILVFLYRKKDYIPVFLRHKNEITGAFLIRRYWMVPIVFFTYMAQQSSISLDFSASWPLIFNVPPLSGAVYALGLDSLVAVLCHTDIAIATQPEKRSARSSILLLGYSTVLMLLAFISRRAEWVGAVGAVFCIGGKEGLYLMSTLYEQKRKPLYSAVRRGIRVLDVLPGSHAAAMGLQRGDVILSINKNDVQSEEGIIEALREFPTYTWIQVRCWDSTEKTLEYRCYPGGYDTLGIITVPRETEVTYTTSYFERISILRNIVNRFKGVDEKV
ncbi:MAG: PDZ domain-containing protein [Clostridiaceae bacterium]|nr:PDZ domain-containing protein [Clostridiaceae bacterium]